MPTILVAGASGLLGGVITRQLLAAGHQVRALGRSAEKLAPLASAGAEPHAVDLLDLRKTTDACRGVSQIVATANNALGRGASSPRRVDLTAYQNLCAAARNTGVGRIIYISFRGASPTASVDFFRLKWHVQDAIRRSGVPYVGLRPSAFADTWAGGILGDAVRKGAATPIFGDGSAVANYIAVDDVARFVVAIVARPEIRNETIEIGGPSDVSLNDLATLVERRLGAPGKRRHIPLVAMRVLRALIKPFNESTARMMSLGLYAATDASPFPQWRAAADRFGITPMTIEEYVRTMPGRS